MSARLVRSYRLDEDLVVRLEDVAAGAGSSASDVVRAALEAYLGRVEAEEGRRPCGCTPGDPHAGDCDGSGGLSEEDAYRLEEARARRADDGIDDWY